MHYGDASTMWGMGLWWLLWLVVVGLVVAAAVKYLFFHPTGRNRRADRDEERGSGRPEP